MKKGSFLNILFGFLATGLIVSCMGMEESDPSSLQVPEVKTFDVKDNGSLVFELSATVDKTIAGRIVECGFYYGKDKSMDGAEKIRSKILDGTYSAEIILREYEETFFACSYISNGEEGNEICSEVKSISVKKLEDYVDIVTPVLLAYDKTSARVSVRYDAADGVEITESGVCWGKSTDLIVGQGSVKAVDGVSELVGLKTGESYYFCSYVKDEEDVAYGKVFPFSVYGSPVVVTDKEPKASSSSVLLSGQVEDDCGKEITERGFLWCEGVVESLDISRNTKIRCGKGMGEYEYTLSGLNPNIAYSFCAYALNEEGVAYGDVVKFTTGLALPAHGKPVVSDIAPFSVMLEGNVLSDGGETALEQGFFWGENSNVANRVECAGSAFRYELTGLSRNTRYYVRSYGVNSVGTGYSEVIEFRTMPELPTISIMETLIEVNEHSAVCCGLVKDDGGETPSEVGFYYSQSENVVPASSAKVAGVLSGSSFRVELNGLIRSTKYYYRAYTVNSSGEAVSSVASFKTLAELPVVKTDDVTGITDESAVSGGSVIDDGGSDITAKGIVWGTMPNPTVSLNSKIDWGGGTASFTAKMTELDYSTKYYVRAYATNSVGTAYGNEVVFETKDIFLEKIPDVSIEETANCYIVSTNGVYRFPAVKGNSTQSVGEVLYAEVLWETFGTDKAPYNGELIKEVRYENGYVVFKTNDIYREGNAVLAVRDSSGTILWSWHIWLTDVPGECVYANDAGVMMDRNLGATSATPGEVGALGLLYQWGRKDPFLGSSSISSCVEAKSTITWPSAVSSSSSRATVAYATEHPTTFITYASDNYNHDWAWYGDNSRWQSTKTIYDPCPAGWHVPEGGTNSVWKNAGFPLGTWYYSYDSSNEGMLFGSRYSTPDSWYPAAGSRNGSDGSLREVGGTGYCRSVLPYNEDSCGFYFSDSTQVSQYGRYHRAHGMSVRCIQE